MRGLKIEKRITARESETIQKYLSELHADSKPISREDEIELFKAYKQGDLMAKDKLIRANLRFVVSVAKQYQGGSSMTLEDLINEGNIGLIKSIDKFDTEKDIKFISYAVWWIRQSILKAVSDSSTIIRLPSNKSTQIKKIKDTKDVLLNKLNREPSLFEISEHMSDKKKISEDEIEEILAINAHALSLYSHAGNEDEGTLMDIIPNENSDSADHIFSSSHNELMVNIAMKFLSEKERAIISMMFGLNGYSQMSVEDIAERVDLTKTRVVQIKDMALRIMKNKMKKNANKYDIYA